MAALNLRIPPAVLPTGVAIATKLDGYTITWDRQADVKFTEVWQHTANVRGSATKVTTTPDAYYDSPTLTVGTTYYVWLRTINFQGQTSDWDLGATSGRSVTVTGAGTANIAPNAVSETVVSTSAVLKQTSTTYGTKTNVSSLAFTGTGNPVLLMNSTPFSVIAEDPSYFEWYEAIYGLYTIQDVDAGGSDISTSYTTGTASQIVYSGATWSNIGNTSADDGVFATLTDTGGSHNDLLFSGFDFSAVPSDATLINVEVVVKAKVSSTTGSPFIIVGLTTTAAADPYDSIATAKWQSLTTTNTSYTFGSSSTHHLGTWADLYPTASSGNPQRMLQIVDVKSADFGVVLAHYQLNTTATISVDYVAVKVHYTTKEYIYNDYRELFVNKNTGAGTDTRKEPFSFTYAFTPTDAVDYTFSVDWVGYIGTFPAGGTIRASSTERITTLVELKR